MANVPRFSYLALIQSGAYALWYTVHEQWNRKNVMRHLIFCVSFQAGQKAQLQTQCWLLLSDCTLILHICDYPFDCCVNCHCSSCFHCWQGLVVYQSYGIACGHVHCQTNLLIWC